jgi:rhamnulokinase
MMEAVFERIPRREIFEQTGIQFLQLNTLYQLFSMAEAGDPQLDMADTLLMTPDLFHYWLSGHMTCEFTIATTSQMFHCQKGRWATELLSELGIPTHFLKPVISPGTILGEIRHETVAETGLAAPVPVIAPGSHDTASAVAAIPELDAQSAYISSGTWSVMGVEIHDPIINDEALSLNFTNEGGVAHTTRLLTNVTGLWLLQESRRQWQREGHDFSWNDLLGQAQRAEPFLSLVDSDSPEFLNPGDMVMAIRGYCQETGQPPPSDVGSVVRCCLESLALKYRWVIDSLETLTGKHLKAIRVVGGGSKNRLLSQFTADACQRRVVTGPVEATALGNVLMQAIATGHIQDIAGGRQAIAASSAQQVFEPGPGDPWEEAFTRFRELLGRETA